MDEKKNLTPAEAEAVSGGADVSGLDLRAPAEVRELTVDAVDLTDPAEAALSPSPAIQVEPFSVWEILPTDLG